MKSDLQSGNGKILGLGTDVFPVEPFPANDDILLHPRVIATPHVAGVTQLSYRTMAKKVAENVIRIESGELPLGLVNSQYFKS